MVRLLGDVRHVLSTSNKACPTTENAINYVLPIFVLQYLMAVLVQHRRTTLFRIALLPLMPSLVLRALLELDFSCGRHDRAQFNAIFFTHLVSTTARTTIWALRQEPYRRENAQKSRSTGILTSLWNAWDLFLNIRGIGWNWSQGIPIPKPSREIHSRPRFLLHTVIRLLFFALAFDAFTEAIRTFSPMLGTFEGGSIIDPSLSPPFRYFRCLEIAYLTVWVAYFAMQWVYQLLAIICLVIFFQHPSQWPPLFDDPWLSTSLSELWGRRWHQMLRYPFVALGGVPCAYLFGRPGGILGTFFLSGLFHDIEIRAVGRRGNFLVEVGFFVMNGVGILLERAWSKWRGRRLSGISGWIWTFSWLALWGIPVVDAWAKSGRFAMETLPLGGIRPTKYLLSLVLPSDVDKGLVLNCLCFGTSLTFLAYSLSTLP